MQSEDVSSCLYVGAAAVAQGKKKVQTIGTDHAVHDKYHRENQLHDHRKKQFSSVCSMEKCVRKAQLHMPAATHRPHKHRFWTRPGRAELRDNHGDFTTSSWHIIQYAVYVQSRGQIDWITSNGTAMDMTVNGTPGE